MENGECKMKRRVAGEARVRARISMSASHSRTRSIVIFPAALVILAAVVAIARQPRPGSHSAIPQDDSPETCVARLLAAERQGNFGAYLECFTESQRARLETIWHDRSPREVAAELQERSAGLVGQAVTAVVLAAPDRASLVLERIEKDHTERQFVDLTRDSGRWQIAKLSAGDWQSPTIPYGAPVFTPASDIAR
jgi:hypothetical protein